MKIYIGRRVVGVCWTRSIHGHSGVQWIRLQHTGRCGDDVRVSTVVSVMMRTVVTVVVVRVVMMRVVARVVWVV